MNVTDRFLKYVSYETTSKEASLARPSTAGQLVLAEALISEMREIGLMGLKLSKEGYVYGYVPANTKGQPVIGLIAHMDTSESANGKNIKPRILDYKGGDIKLSEEVYTRQKDFPMLKSYKGQRLIVTDGSTLLGADDKAGIAEILTACEYIINHKEIKHGKIAIGFTPDEEIGRGADFFNLKTFGADFAYTVDGGALGELEYESFNAAGARVVFNGLNVHPGYAKGIMKNSLLMANDFISQLPDGEDPAHTEGYEGYYHVQHIAGDETRTQLEMIIRDHDMKKFVSRKKKVFAIAKAVEKKWGKGSVEITVLDSYYNMKDVLKNHMDVVDRAKKAMEKSGVVPKIVAIRGGTDGCRLSYEGLPCPNLSTGGENFHGINEFISINSMEKMVEVLINLVKGE